MYFILVFIFNWIRYMYWNLQWKQEFSKNRSCSPLCGPNHRKLFTTGYLSIIIVGNKVPESGSTGYLSNDCRKQSTRIWFNWFLVYKDCRKQSVQESGSTGYLSNDCRKKVPESGSTGFLSIMIVGSKMYQNLVHLVPNSIIENKNNLLILRGHNIYMLRYLFFSRDW